MREYKFFHGRGSKTRVTWVVDEEGYRDENLLDNMAEQIQRVLDDELVSQLTRTINGGNNMNYLNHYINMGGGNRA